MNWHGKRYYSLDSNFKNTFGKKIYKVSLNGGFSCPNRDGTIGTGGCIFCSEGGSGDFSPNPNLSITKQIDEGISLVAHKNNSGSYLAYFQAFTNTYAPVEKLRSLFTEALNHPAIMGLSIGTRPDCLPEPVLDLLEELNQKKPIFIELGLQTIHEETADFIHRGYPLSTFEIAVENLHKRNITIVTHLILGLPGETNEMILESIHYLNNLPIDGIKLSLLHVLKNTKLGTLYEKEPFKIYTFEEYVDLVITCIQHLRSDIVIHRFTGDGPRELLIAPKWSLHKKKVLNQINHQLKERNIYQGDLHSSKII
ncbi:MAG: TIGR01212 family radical SAM protein [Anaerostipes sp.]|nr:TIGR01212 family radical SAM protein [Anaerostipes sp.]